MIIAGPTERPRLSRSPSARRPSARGMGLGRLLLALTGAAALLFAAARVMAPSGVAPDGQAGAPAPELRWTAVGAASAASAAYRFDGGLFGSVPDRHEARRRGDGARIDDMAWGVFASAGSRWLHLRVYRPVAALEPETAFFVDMARIASRRGLAVRRAGLPALMETGLGPMAVADLYVAGPHDEAACLGFRLRNGAPAFELSGIACGAANQPFGQPDLTCALDRLKLADARADPELAAHFAAARSGSHATCKMAGKTGRKTASKTASKSASKTASKSASKSAEPDRPSASRSARAP